MALGTVWATGTFADTGVWADGAWADVPEYVPPVPTGKYAPQHTSALATLERKGSAVTFTFTSGTHTPATGTFASPTTATVAGQAIRLPGDVRRYAALGLTEREAITLLFAPTTYGANPEVGATFTFGSDTFTVATCDPLAIDGFTLLVTIVGRR